MAADTESLEEMENGERAHEEGHRLLSNAKASASLEVENPSDGFESKTKSKRRKLITTVSVVSAAILLIVVVVSLVVRPQSAEDRIRALCKADANELFDLLHPEHYSVSLELLAPTQPQAEDERFNGFVHMEGALSKSSKCIALHGVDIKVHTVEILSGNSSKIGSAVHTLSDLLVFAAEDGNTFSAGRVSLSVSYDGAYGKGFGLYKADFRSRSEAVTATQFETVGARRAFPCLDKPAAKAKFTVSLNVPMDEGLVALSNMEANRVEEEGDRATHHFGVTPVMSTYLVAVAVGRFNSVESQTESSMAVRVWATAEHDAKHLSVPAEASVKALEFYESYTNFTLPFAKMDLVAVPGRGGAMENWGLLLMDEPRFLWNGDDEGYYGTLETMNVICHEVAHQWFGNLVTCTDWEEIALNEGFGSFMEYKCMGHLGQNSALLFEVNVAPPSKEVRVHFPGARQNSLDFDFGEETHALAGSTSHFDLIAYSKGAAVVRMFEDYVGEEKFQRGIRLGLREYAFGNARFEDLLAFVLAETGQLSVHNFTEWIYQPSYPTLFLPERVVHPGKSWYKPIRFDYLGRENETESTFLVPVKYKHNENPEVATALIGKDEKSLEIIYGAALVNYGAGGYFRVRYSGSHDYMLILDDARSSSLGEWDESRILTVSSLLSDMFALTNRNAMGPKTVMNVLDDSIATQGFRKGDIVAEYAIVVPTFVRLSDWALRLGPVGCADALTLYIKSAASAQWGPNPISYSFQGGESGPEKLVRAQAAVIKGQCPQNDTSGSVDLEMRAAAYILRASLSCSPDDGGRAAFDEIKAAFLSARLPGMDAERSRSLYALGRIRSPALLREALEMALEGKVGNETLSSSEASMILRGAADNSHLQGSAEMREVLAKEFARMDEVCSKCVDRIFGLLLSEAQAKEVLIQALDMKQTTESRRKELLRKVSLGEQWRSNTGAQICDWFRGNKYSWQG